MTKIEIAKSDYLKQIEKMSIPITTIADDLEYFYKAITPTQDELINDFYTQYGKYTNTEITFGDYFYTENSGLHYIDKHGFGIKAIITIKDYVFIDLDSKLALQFAAVRIYKTKSVEIRENRFMITQIGAFLRINY
jgi:hypothetical protein